MGESTGIEWCHHTFNPWWGCVRVSPGCEHCYAEAFSKRVGGHPSAKGQHWGVTGLRTIASEKGWREPLKWDLAAQRAGERRRVFCASMADVFEDRPDLEPHRHRLFALIEATPHLDWLILTKRPEQALLWFGGTSGAGLSMQPLPNLWMGVTAEDQKRADERISLLLEIPAAVRFVSYEPALEHVDFSEFVTPGYASSRGGQDAFDGIDWVIVGGESGPGARPFDIKWARSAVRQCKDAGVPVFVKQLGAKPVGDPNCVCGAWGAGVCGPRPANAIGKDDCEATSPPRLVDRKGGDPSEWPEDLRVREWPRG